MNEGTGIVLGLTGSLIAVTVITLKLFRAATRSPRRSALVREGVVLTETGIKFPRLVLMGTVEADYTTIESVTQLPFWTGLVSIGSLRYGISLRSVWTRLFCDIVVVEFTGPGTRYLLLTPSEPSAFVAELKSRIRQAKTVRRHSSPRGSSGTSAQQSP
jgi:hypothetical protein